MPKPNTCTLPAGLYYVGDLCFVLAERNEAEEGYDWDTVLNDTGTLGCTRIDGEPLEPDEPQPCCWTIGHWETGEPVEFFSSHTSYGDGTYTDEQGREYPVDAGLIGVFPMWALPDSCGGVGPVRGGNIINFKQAFCCHTVDEEGVILIGQNIYIETGAD